MRFILVMSTSLATLVGSHYLLYFTTVKFLDIQQRSARMGLLAALMLLSVSFIAAMILSRVAANPVTGAFLSVTAFWMGLVVYLIMAMALIWIVFGAGKLAGRVPDMKVICGALYGVALVVALYATVNASSPRVTRLQVELADLPAHWKGGTVVQLTDVHLGSIRTTRYLDRVVERVNSLEPDLILITGDLFDGSARNLGVFAEGLDALRADRGVYFVMGNHEGYLGLEEPRAVLERTRIRILDDEVVDVDGLQIMGLAYPEFDQEKSEASELTIRGELRKDLPSILLYHTPTDVVGSSEDRAQQQSRAYFAPPTTYRFARDRHIDLQLSGHTHGGQFWPFTALTRWIYNGYHYGLHEQDGFAIYISSGTGTWGPPMRLLSVSEIVHITLK